MSGVPPNGRNLRQTCPKSKTLRMHVHSFVKTFFELQRFGVHIHHSRRQQRTDKVGLAWLWFGLVEVGLGSVDGVYKYSPARVLGER